MKQGQIRSIPVNFRYLRGVDIFLTAIEFIWNSWFQNYRLWTSVLYNFSFEEIKKSSSNDSLNSWLLLKPFEWDTNWDTVRSQFKLKIQLRQFKRKKIEYLKLFWTRNVSLGSFFEWKRTLANKNCIFNWFRVIFEWKQCSSTYLVYFLGIFSFFVKGRMSSADLIRL